MGKHAGVGGRCWWMMTGHRVESCTPARVAEVPRRAAPASGWQALLVDKENAQRQRPTPNAQGSTVNGQRLMKGIIGSVCGEKAPGSWSNTAEPGRDRIEVLRRAGKRAEH